MIDLKSKSINDRYIDTSLNVKLYIISNIDIDETQYFFNNIISVMKKLQRKGRTKKITFES